MSIQIEIKKKLYNFYIDIKVNTDSRRIGILGASGSGKSMTLKSIAGIETPDEGRIVVDGSEWFHKDGKKASVNFKPQKRKVGYLFQNYALFPNMTVEKNIAAGLKATKAENDFRVKEMIKKFHLEGLECHFPNELSGGQQQRVALARIMAYEPEVILLDEPFSALDGFLKDRLQQEMLQFLEDYPGIVVLVSHSRDEIYRFCEELVILDEGHTVCQGNTKEVFANPGYVEAAKLTGCKNIVKAERIDAHSLHVPEWNLQLKLKKEIDPEIQYVGVRAHDFVPLWTSENSGCVGTFQAEVKSIAELPFERKIFLRSQDDKKDICWFVQRNMIEEIDKKGMPAFLGVTEDKLLLLK